MKFHRALWLSCLFVQCSLTLFFCALLNVLAFGVVGPIFGLWMAVEQAVEVWNFEKGKIDE